MLNVNKVTSELSMLPDQALQQFAAMHKADPYMLSLAVAESNRRKDMRAAPQMAAGQPPKVADQAIAGMAPSPETVGIGQLPAQNMQRMAGGGIVAFADGGDTGGSGDPWYLQPSTDVIPNIPDIIGEQWRKLRQWQQANVGRAKGAKTPGDVRKLEPVERVGLPEGYAPGAAPAVAGEDAELPDMDETRVSGAAGSRRRTGIAGIAPRLDTAPVARTNVPSMAERAAAVRAQAAAADADTAGAYDPFKKLLQQERADIGKKDNVKDALIRAGLGMLGGTSPFAMVNIGKGGIEGLDAYQKAQAADEAARRANTNAQMLLMQAQRAERSGNMRDATQMYGQYRQEIRDAQAFDQHAQELKNTEAYRNADLQLRQQLANQQGEYYRAMGQSKFANKDLATLKAQQANLQAQLKADPNMQYLDKENYDRITQSLQEINDAIARQPGGVTLGGTAAPSSAGWGKAVAK